MHYYFKYANVGYCTLDEPPRLMSMKQINDIHHGTWPSTCSMWLISFVHRHSLWIAGISYFLFKNQFSTDWVSPQTFIVIRDIHVPLNLMKMCMSTLHKFDTQCKLYYVLRNTFSKMFSLTELHTFLLPMCLYCKFAKFSCCQSFPPYGSRYTLIKQSRNAIAITKRIILE